MTKDLQIFKWNYTRNGLILDRELEDNMLDEEYDEYIVAVKEYTDNLEEARCIKDSLTDVIDAYCDFRYVLSGTKAKGYFDATRDIQLKYMEDLLCQILVSEKYTSPFGVINKAMQLVIDANEAKTKDFTTGKISKGLLWVDPKIKIKELLK